MEKDAIEKVIRSAPVCRLGLADGTQPYVVPLCFGYEEETLYFHSAPRGRKLDIIRRNNSVCLQFDADVELVRRSEACKWGVRYRSVIAFGKAVVVEDTDEKIHALDLIMHHYSGREWEFSPEVVRRTTVVRVDIEHMTGKSAGY
ncbi:MAG: pyridoxamine 5'-phosphate oxidase family protein [Candidatus Brocadiaceae bacterium]